MDLASMMLRARYDCGFKIMEPRILIQPPKYEPPSILKEFDEWWGSTLARHGLLLPDDSSIGEVLGWSDYVLHLH